MSGLPGIQSDERASGAISDFGADSAMPEARKHSEDDSMSTLKRMALTVGSLAAALLAGAASFRIT